MSKSTISNLDASGAFWSGTTFALGYTGAQRPLATDRDGRGLGEPATSGFTVGGRVAACPDRPASPVLVYRRVDRDRTTSVIRCGREIARVAIQARRLNR